jgi:anti-sigma regulatory factor (Ser/Thr protein kinase)
MSGRADVVYGSSRVDGYDLEHSSGVGPAPKYLRGATTTAWSLTSLLALGALPTAPSCARLHTRAVLHEWGLTEQLEAAELVVSELVTNAIQAATELAACSYLGLPVIHLRLLACDQELVIEVWDDSPQAPVLEVPEPEDEDGRGLMLVDALCDCWGSEVVPGWSGKVVRAGMRIN